MLTYVYNMYYMMKFNKKLSYIISNVSVMAFKQEYFSLKIRNIDENWANKS